MYIHPVDGLGLAPIELPDLRSIVRFPVANLSIRTTSDDLTLVRPIAHCTEHCVGKDHLTTNKTPGEREKTCQRINEIFFVGNSLFFFFEDLLQVPDNACSIRTGCDTLHGGNTEFLSIKLHRINQCSHVEHDGQDFTV